MATESFEKKLAAAGKAIDEALAALVNAGSGEELKPKEKAKKKVKIPPAQVRATKDQVRDALRRVIGVGGNDACSTILEGFGVNKISKLEIAEFDRVVEAAEAYLDENGESPDDVEEE